MKNDKFKQKLNLHTIILADPNLSDGAVRVAGALLFVFHNTKSGQCFPTNATIGVAVGMHPKTVSKHVGELVRAGYLIRCRRYNKSSMTAFNWAKGSDEAVKAIRQRGDEAKSLPSDGAIQGGVWSDSGGSMERNRGARIHEIATLTSESNQRNEPGNLTFREERAPAVGSQESGYSNPDTCTTHPTPDNCPTTHGRDHDNTRAVMHSHDDPLAVANPLATDFEHFWAVYPRREKKEEARQEFVAAVEAGISPQILIGKAGAFARSVAGKETRYIPFPATWLRDKRWTDDYETVPDNPYTEEDAKYPPCPPGMRPDAWRGMCRVHGDKLMGLSVTGNKPKQLN
jgi:hypothetical protein